MGATRLVAVGVRSESEETAQSVCDVEPLPKPDHAAHRNSSSGKRNSATFHGSTTKHNSPETALRQEATLKFEATVKRFQEIAGDQSDAQAIFQAAIDCDPICNVHKMALEIEQYVLLFKEERRAQLEGRSQREGEKNTVFNKVVPVVQGTVAIASAVAAVRSP